VSKMNGRMRKKFFELLWKRDGPYCKCCGKLAWERPLVIDHKDNNNSNNSPENHQFLCRSCNYLKNPRRPVDMCVRTSPPISPDSSLAINKRSEPEFRKFVYEELNNLNGDDKKYGIETTSLINAGAEKVEVCIVTAGRYLDKMCSSSGKLCFGPYFSGRSGVKYKKKYCEVH